MNFLIRIPLNAAPEQQARLRDLQVVFARACNELAPHVQQSRVWNRVALHHLHYRALREKFPELGSQMICNAIYSVSKMARLVYQHPDSPFNPASRPGVALPLLRFADSCPVYFDRHTLSLRQGKLSMFTLDGRMRFELSLTSEQLALFEQSKLREIVLDQRADGVYQLSFFLASQDALQSDAGGATEVEADVEPDAERPALPPATTVIPEYVSVEVPR